VLRIPRPPAPVRPHHVLQTGCPAVAAQRGTAFARATPFAEKYMTRYLLIAIAFVAAAAAGSAQAPASGAKTWIGRAPAMETHLRDATVVRLEDLDVGVTRPRRAHVSPSDPFESFAWKALSPGMRGGYFESYKSEIAAYELDKLLEMGMVPPAVERRVDGEVGVAIMWLDGTTSVKERGGKMPTGPAFGKPIRMMQMFDNLIGNADRNAGNILVDGADNLILIDHSRAFITKPGLPWTFERVDAALWTKMRALTAQQLSGALGAWADEQAVRAMLGRRDRMQTAIDTLVKAKGAAAVIVP
jgi:hypothetical protein